MAKRSSIATLPTEVRHWLERALTENGFSGYVELEQLLREQGYIISKSAIHCYGQKLERCFKAIKNSMEAARLIAEMADDEGDKRSEALMALIQTALFDGLVDLEEADQLPLPEKIMLLGQTGKNIASLTTASTKLKKYQADFNAKLQAKMDELELHLRQALRKVIS